MRRSLPQDGQGPRASVQKLQYSHRTCEGEGSLPQENHSIPSVITNTYALYNGDCVKVLPGFKDESIDFCLFSPPFASLYKYSDSPEDFGNCRSYEEFFIQYSFLVKELYRLLTPGRIVAVHCMEIPTLKNSGEEIGLRDFPGDLIRCHQECGMIYHSRFVIWKDPLVAATRTKALGLAHKQIVKDSSMCRTGIPDYILAFRKPGENPKPIKHSQGLREYYGSQPIPHELNGYLNSEDQGKNKRSHLIWQRYASPVWMDIRQTKVLPYRQAREQDDERHICPLQLDVIERCLELWSTTNDIVLDPFGGVGSTAYCAVKAGRKAVSIELKESYFLQMRRNVKQAVRQGMTLGEKHG